MNNQIIVYSVVIALFSFLLIASSYRQARIISGKAKSNSPGSSYINNLKMYVFYIATFIECTVFMLIMYSAYKNSAAAASLLQPFFTLSAYYCLVALCLPLLRKRISPQICAVLWMIPLLIFIFYRHYPISFTPGEYFHLQLKLPFALPRILPSYIFIIWITGTTLVLFWHIASHLYLRRKLLKDAVIVKDPDINALWLRELMIANFKNHSFLLMTSKQALTPLSVGLFRRSICVFLPEKSYAQDELKLILRHELSHISRYDNMMKFFLMLCSAMFWFNPLMWLAMRRCTEDLELSCDEITLVGCSQEDRQKYAELLLTTAADDRGFSSCLSSSAKSLLYRLKNVISPKKHLFGGLFAGLITLVLIIFTAFVDITWSCGTAGKQIFPADESTTYQFEDGYFCDRAYSQRYLGADLNEILDYLDTLPVSSTFRKIEPCLDTYVHYNILTKDTTYRILIFEEYIYVFEYQKESSNLYGLLLEEPADFELLKSFMHTPKK